jgi:hypothetical protein
LSIESRHFCQSNFNRSQFCILSFFTLDLQSLSWGPNHHPFFMIVTRKTSLARKRPIAIMLSESLDDVTVRLTQ